MQTQAAFRDRIKLPFAYDANQLKEDLKNINRSEYEYYKVIPLRAPAHLVDTSLPFPPPADNYADGSWTDWMDTPSLEKVPYIASIIKELEKITTVNLVRLLFLAPQSVVKEHTDPTLALEELNAMIRLTIPIDNNDKVEFYLNDTLVHMNEGECWYLKLNDPHRVINDGTRDRINLTIDVLPNDRMRKLIAEAG